MLQKRDSLSRNIIDALLMMSIGPIVVGGVIFIGGFGGIVCIIIGIVIAAYLITNQ